MLKDVIEFVKSRANIQDRDVVLREINFAWRELWIVDDMPNSVQEVTVQGDTNARLSLPYYVEELRAVKPNCSRYPTIQLLTPRTQYDETQYIQSPFTWQVLGTNPLNRTIDNATTLNLKFAEPVTEQVIATLSGPTENAAEDREQIIFLPNESSKQTTKRFMDLTSASKDSFTSSDLRILDYNNEELGLIPNAAFEGRYTIVQITDKCNQPACCTPCKCYDVLFKRAVPFLYYDEQHIPNGFQEALMTKTMEWILLPKDEQEKKALLFADKTKALMSLTNEDNNQGMRRKLDLGRNKFTTSYHGYL